ncbi:hypothetical protein GIS00_05565 [Nakamurella sp. YIM 132087]|uniref:VCBS repeat-containing protein n=1 Tax=Nakamurella alba TaxID=2665158 RepID=A0A7K1FH13_9ACTN|nr:VCBS repeat-containing protein [Nakamurella alba]MTD13411.1 hypothetical protein [Nakamurella alba]
MTSRLRRPIRAVVAASVSLVAALLPPIAAAATPAPAQAAAGYFTEVPATQVNGSGYVPIIGDFGGGPTDDILWYAYAGGTSHLWRSLGNGAFTSTSIPIAGAGYGISVGDFVGDGRDEIIWTPPKKGAAASMWRFDIAGRTYATTRVDTTGWTSTPRPITGNRAGIKTDLFLDGGSAGTSRILSYTWPAGGALTVASRTVTRPAGLSPTAGDFDGNGRADILWTGPGTGDLIWLGIPTSTGSTRFRADPAPIIGNYVAIAGDLDDGAADDVLFLGSGTTANVWTFATDGSHTSRKARQPDAFIEGVLHTTGSDVLLTRDDAGAVGLWRFNGGSTVVPTGNAAKPSPYRAAIGAFTGNGTVSSVLWWAPGSTPERMFLGRS